MRRDERRFLIVLSVAVIAQSTVGWKLDDQTFLRTVLFYADTAVGMALLAFALAIEATDSGDP
jgi:hypothetical protein